MVFSQGDIVEVDFSPALGHEPMKKRPGLVVSNDVFNISTSMTMVCPIMSTDNNFFLHEPVPSGHDVIGYIALEQMKAFDLKARKAEYIDHLDYKEMKSITDFLKSIF